MLTLTLTFHWETENHWHWPTYNHWQTDSGKSDTDNVRSNSLARKCDECSYVARKLSQTRQTQGGNTYVYTCDLSKITYQKYHGDKLLWYIKNFHENSDKIFTDEEFNQLVDIQQFEIKKGPETVKKKQVH